MMPRPPFYLFRHRQFRGPEHHSGLERHWLWMLGNKYRCARNPAAFSPQRQGGSLEYFQQLLTAGARCTVYTRTPDATWTVITVYDNKAVGEVSFGRESEDQFPSRSWIFQRQVVYQFSRECYALHSKIKILRLRTRNSHACQYALLMRVFGVEC